MRKSLKNWQKMCAIVLAVIMLTAPVSTPIVEAQRLIEEARQARIDAKNDAEAVVNKPIWFIVGYLASGIGVGVAAGITPEPPIEKCLGKSSEYMIVYIDTYRETVRKIQTTYALYGYGACILTTIALFVL